MDLNKCVPDNSNNWSISKDQILYKRCGINIPVCRFYDNILYIFLDNSEFHKPIIKLVKHLMRLDVEFYFYPPTYSHPGATFKHDDVIYHYLISYANKKFNIGFSDIDFDLIDNMVKWCKKENCFDLIKDSHLRAHKKIKYSWYNHYSNKFEFDYDEYIRDDFKALYRYILINQII